MQKARRHPITGLRPLVSVWFQGLFTPLLRVLFTFPSQYSFTIGLLVVFSLTGWCRQIQREFHQLPPTQDTPTIQKSYQYRALTSFGLPSQTVLVPLMYRYRSPTTPVLPKQYWFGLIRFRSPLLTESLLFSLPLLT